ncbi:MAG: chlorophyll synthase ChlG [Gammaproteobacteria bacterium]|nr:chlorophyll synthase ChlG [Gammaproteobacteria bacterium]
MLRTGASLPSTDWPAPRAVLELLKPITWFPPMWAFGCGAVAAAAPFSGRWPYLAAGLVLCGPLLCATSQAVNDWFDREVDAINEPDRPIPSGRMPGRSGLYVALLWSALSLGVATALGSWVFGAAAIGLALAWAYSAPPLRLKKNGWWGNAACAICYEGFAWATGSALAGAGAPTLRTLALAGLYSFGAHGIMTLNDFKSLEGDRRLGIGSLPARLGPERAARVACAMMAAAQVAVAILLWVWGRPAQASVVLFLLLAQGALMRRLLADPRAKAPWYNATGISLYVLGMLASAWALRSLGG